MPTTNSSSDEFYSMPVAFQFQVTFNGLGSSNERVSEAFSEVSGLNVSLNYESLKEGGARNSEYKLITEPKYDTLKLKRGIVTNSALLSWINDALYHSKVKPCNVVVTLDGPDETPLVSWSIYNAYPLQLKVEPFNALENKLAIEEIELAYEYCKRQ